MSQDRISQIRQRLAAANTQVWDVDQPAMPNWQGVQYTQIVPFCTICHPVGKTENVDLIRHAPSDLEWCLNEIERAENNLGVMTTEVEALEGRLARQAAWYKEQEIESKRVVKQACAQVESLQQYLTREKAQVEALTKANESLTWQLQDRIKIEHTQEAYHSAVREKSVWAQKTASLAREASQLKAQLDEAQLTIQRFNEGVDFVEAVARYEAMRKQLAEAIELVKEHGFDAFGHRPKKVAAFLERVK